MKELARHGVQRGMNTQYPHDETCEAELRDRVSALLAALGIAPSPFVEASVTDYSSHERRREHPWSASVTAVGEARLYEITGGGSLHEFGPSARAVTDALIADLTARIERRRAETAAALLKVAVDAAAWDAASRAWTR